MSNQLVTLQNTDINIGELWQHHSGDVYVIINFTNKEPKPGWETNVIYANRNKPDDWYNRPLAEFVNKFIHVVE